MSFSSSTTSMLARGMVLPTNNGLASGLSLETRQYNLLHSQGKLLRRANGCSPEEPILQRVNPSLKVLRKAGAPMSDLWDQLRLFAQRSVNLPTSASTALRQRRVSMELVLQAKQASQTV